MYPNPTGPGHGHHVSPCQVRSERPDRVERLAWIY